MINLPQNTDGTLTEEGAKALIDAQIALTQGFFKNLATLSQEDIRATIYDGEYPETLKKVIENSVRAVVDADLPMSVLSAVPKFPEAVFRRIITSMEASFDATENLLVASILGKETYNDVSFKDVANRVEALSKQKKAVDDAMENIEKGA